MSCENQNYKDNFFFSDGHGVCSSKLAVPPAWLPTSRVRRLAVFSLWRPASGIQHPA